MQPAMVNGILENIQPSTKTNAFYSVAVYLKKLNVIKLEWRTFEVK